jgi:phenylacetate-coenzyme A ligase PaaK-like adenylate-forming protein
MAGYQELRQRHVKTLLEIVPEHVERLRWPVERIAEARQAGLRALLQVAKERSPWHRERLRGIDPATACEADVETLPPMTKRDLMEHWDDIVTDPRLRLDVVERHLAGLTNDAYLLDEFHPVASGGSTGRRGVFVYGWDAWATAYAGFVRPMFWDRMAAPELAAVPNSLAMVAAQNATHMTSAIGQTFSSPALPTERFPVTMPLGAIVDGLNAFRPTTLLGYASALAVLAAEARGGRLRIAPSRVISTSEPLLPEVRQAVEEAFRAPVANVWGTSEAGPMAMGCWRGPGMHLCDDLVVIEPVDRAGRPVTRGTRSDLVYVTGLSNPALPLIRFELTDQITVLDRPCPCGSAHRLIADVEGRLDDLFAYDRGVLVHPHVFRSVLARATGIVEYRVRQTAQGAEILALGVIDDCAATSRVLEGELARLGGCGAVRGGARRSDARAPGDRKDPALRPASLIRRRAWQDAAPLLRNATCRRSPGPPASGRMDLRLWHAGCSSRSRQCSTPNRQGVRVCLLTAFRWASWQHCSPWESRSVRGSSLGSSFAVRLAATRIGSRRIRLR